MSYTQILGILANLAITAGYFFVAVKIAPNFKIKYLYTKIGGIFFFVLCGLTHAMMAYYDFTEQHRSHTSWPYLLIHVPQAIAVWMFVIGLYREFISEGRTAWATKRLREKE